MNPAEAGTKAAAHYRITVGAGQSVEIKLRLAPVDAAAMPSGPFGDFNTIVQARRQEADAFYASITPPSVSRDAALVMRQALAGMLWSKQFFYYDIGQWLDEHGVDPYASRGAAIRNAQWAHMVNADVVSMPDKWEYPWYAAWDLAFHVLALNMVDPDLARASCCSSCSSTTCTRTARSPPTSGTSATSTRPCTPGPPGSSTARTSCSAVKAIWCS